MNEILPYNYDSNGTEAYESIICLCEYQLLIPAAHMMQISVLIKD